MARTCPRDGEILHEAAGVFENEVSVFSCPQCAGVMVEWAAARKLFASLNFALADLKSAVSAAEARPVARAFVPCSACEKGALKAFRVKGIELDRCTECGVTWFDRSELSRVSGGRWGQSLSTQEAGLKPNESVIGVYEMLWDCPYCATHGLLGASNRFCPQCGAAQDAERRYFPPPGKEVASNLAFEGADVVCPACSTPNGAKAVHCRHCGNPLDGAAVHAAQVVEQTPRSAPVASASATRRWPWVIAGAAGLMLSAFCGLTVFWKKPASVTVAAATWSRSVDVERLQATSSSAWCDSMPGDAYGVSRRRVQRSTNRIPDGQTCTTRNVDRGNGTFERRQECSTDYREEPVYDERCTFTVNRWLVGRTVTAAGQGAIDSPVWPAVALKRSAASLEAEREGPRHEKYEVALTGPKGEAWRCTVPYDKWKAFREGEKRELKVSVVLGSIDCGSL